MTVQIEFRPPRRPFHWPPLVEQLPQLVAYPSRHYLVGGIVRDALRGQPGYDLDLVTLDDGLQVARLLADRLGGAYYPVDPERHTGRVILNREGDQPTIIDIASLRGADLLADLVGRDFTINAMVVPLADLEQIGDPLGGETDLLVHKVLRQCSPDSIASDPVRALRAVRQSIQFNLRIEKETLAAVRAHGIDIASSQGELQQPERVRDEFIKILAGPRPAGALRLVHNMGLWQAIVPFETATEDEPARQFALVERLHDLFTIISPQRDDNTAADLILGVAVMILDRHRHFLQDHLNQQFADGRPRCALSYLVALTPPDEPAISWADWLRLSRIERHALERIYTALQIDLPQHGRPGDVTLHRYYREVGEAGMDGLLLRVAYYLADHWPTPNAEEWGLWLDQVISPALDAFVRRYQEVVAPPPLITGDDLVSDLHLKPGPRIGQLLETVLEAQISGKVKTKKQALRLAERLAASEET